MQLPRIEIYSNKVNTIPFLFQNEATIYKISKSSNTVTVTTIEPHGFSSSTSATVEMSTPNANFDGAITIATTPTTRSLTYTLTGSDVTESLLFGKIRSSFNITGKTLKLTIKDSIDDTDANKLYQGTLTIVTGADGLASLTMTASDSNIANGIYYFDVQDDTTDEYLFGGIADVKDVIRDDNT